MNRKASSSAVAAMLANLTDEELFVLTRNSACLKAEAARLLAEEVQNTFVVHIADKDLLNDLVETAKGWRKLASDLGYTGPVAWKVNSGFGLKTHASKAGPCYKNFEYLQDWSLQNDEPTQDAIVFWIPRLVEGSTSKTVAEQVTLMGETRTKYSLPSHYLVNFGSASLLSALVLAHFKRTGERTPLNVFWAGTDTLHTDGNRLNVGNFDESGFNCDNWNDDDRNSNIGFFPLMVSKNLEEDCFSVLFCFK